MKYSNDFDSDDPIDDPVVKHLCSEESAYYGAFKDLRAGVPIHYSDPEYPETNDKDSPYIVREYPDGRRFIVKVDIVNETFEEVRQIPESKGPKWTDYE
jgi:hypothetical protein